MKTVSASAEGSRVMLHIRTSDPAGVATHDYVMLFIDEAEVFLGEMNTAFATALSDLARQEEELRALKLAKLEALRGEIARLELEVAKTEDAA